MQKKYLAAIYQKVRRIYEDEASGKFLCLPDATQVLSPEVLKCLVLRLRLKLRIILSLLSLSRQGY